MGGPLLSSSLLLQSKISGIAQRHHSTLLKRITGYHWGKGVPRLPPKSSAILVFGLERSCKQLASPVNRGQREQQKPEQEKKRAEPGQSEKIDLKAAITLKSCTHKATQHQCVTHEGTKRVLRQGYGKTEILICFRQHTLLTDTKYHSNYSRTKAKGKF